MFFFDLRLLVGPLVSFQKYWLSDLHIVKVPDEIYFTVHSNLDIYLFIKPKLCQIIYYFFLNFVSENRTMLFLIRI